jgi:hypothetical protein
VGNLGYYIREGFSGLRHGGSGSVLSIPVPTE